MPAIQWFTPVVDGPAKILWTPNGKIAWDPACCCLPSDCGEFYYPCDPYFQPIKPTGCIVIPAYIEDNCDFAEWINSITLDMILPAGWSGPFGGCPNPVMGCEEHDGAVLALELDLVWLASTGAMLWIYHGEDFLNDYWCYPWHRAAYFTIECEWVDDPMAPPYFISLRCFAKAYLDWFAVDSPIGRYQWKVELPLKVDLENLYNTLPNPHTIPMTLKIEDAGQICLLAGTPPITIKNHV